MKCQGKTHFGCRAKHLLEYDPENHVPCYRRNFIYRDYGACRNPGSSSSCGCPDHWTLIADHDGCKCVCRGDCLRKNRGNPKCGNPSQWPRNKIPDLGWARHCRVDWTQREKLYVGETASGTLQHQQQSQGCKGQCPDNWKLTQYDPTTGTSTCNCQGSSNCSKRDPRPCNPSSTFSSDYDTKRWSKDCQVRWYNKKRDLCLDDRAPWG